MTIITRDGTKGNSDFPRDSDSPSGGGRILARLTDARGGWVSARDLSRIALGYTRCIHELRHRDGLVIENESVWVRGVRHGYYRLPLYAGQPAPELPEKSDRVERHIPTQPETVQEPCQMALGLSRNSASDTSNFLQFERGLKTAESR